MELAVQNFRMSRMYQIAHRTEGSLPHHKTHAIELADISDELGGHCS